MKKIAVVRGGAIGDFVLTLPAIEALRRAYPRAFLSLVGRPHILCLARADALVDGESAALAPLYAPSAPLPPSTAALFAGADLVLAYSTDSEGALAARLRALVGGRVAIHDPRPPLSFSGHVAEHLLAPIEGLGIQADPMPHIHLQGVDRAWSDAHLQDLSGPLTLLHPGSGGVRKCWAEKHFRALAARLRDRGLDARFVLGPTEVERGLDLPALRPPDLRQLAGLLARASLFVGNDSGPGHMAAAVGAPVLSLFGPTDPRLWAPRGPRVRVLRAPGGRLDALAVDSVLEAALSLLAAGEPGHE